MMASAMLRPKRVSTYAICGVLCCGVAALAQTAFIPARYVEGSVPQIPFQATGGGEVLLEVALGSTGAVGGIRPLRTTPPYSDAVMQALRDWRFSPAVEQGARTASHVLVAGEFRPPTINTPTLGEAPRDAASPSADIPFPTATVQPGYPPLARDSGVVLVEARIDAGGNVVAATAIRSRPPFDAPAIDALRQWKFTPARVRGTPVESVAYVFFGFRQPLTVPGRTP
jgi:TonB family protein